jgi:hypothetical protein
MVGLQGPAQLLFTHLILILIRFFGSAQIGSEWDDKDDATLSMDAVWLASTPMPG